MCNCKKKSKCSPEYTKTVKRLQNKIKTLLGLKPTSERGLKDMLVELDYSKSCPDKTLVKAIQDYTDNEYTKHFKQK